MSGIKISNLPVASKPLAGSEQFALVQNSCTKVATVNDICDIFRDAYTSLTTYASTSGVYTTVNSSSATWDSVYSSYQSTSADFAQTDQTNTFCSTQTFCGKIIAGYATTACGAYASTIGGYYNDASGNGSIAVGGCNNDTYGQFSFIGSGNSNSITNTGTEGAIVGGGCGQLTHPKSVIAGGTGVTSVSGCMLHAQSLYLKDLPTTDPGVAGVVWNDSGTLKISQ